LDRRQVSAAYSLGENMSKLSEYLARKKRLAEINAEGHDGYDWYEGQTKWPITRIIKVAFCTISAIVWVVILFRIFSMSNSEYEKMILLDEKAAAIYPERVSQVVSIYTSTEDQVDNSVLLFYPVYLEETQNMQFTARVNRKDLAPGDGQLGYTFVLRKASSMGVEYYPVSYHAKEKSFRYTFYRLCFDGVPFNMEDNDSVYTFLLFQGDYQPKMTGGDAYPATDAAFQFTILNSETYCLRTTPSKGVFETLN
jgi:hypothetical protein